MEQTSNSFTPCSQCRALREELQDLKDAYEQAAVEADEKERLHNIRIDYWRKLAENQYSELKRLEAESVRTN